MRQLDTVLVVPCFNESKRLDVKAFRSFLHDTPWLATLFVNDGSSDRTIELLDQLASESNQVGVVDLQTNSGKAEAVRIGICNAFELGADYIGFWDADLATPLDSVIPMRDVLTRREEIEFVIGTRLGLQGHNIQRKRIRAILGRTFANVASHVIGKKIVDTQCGAKLFRNNQLLRESVSRPFLSRWIFDVELMTRYQQLLSRTHTQNSLKLFEYPLESWKDVDGSNVKPRDFIKAFRELVQIAFNSKFVPLTNGFEMNWDAFRLSGPIFDRVASEVSLRRRAA